MQLRSGKKLSEEQKPTSTTRIQSKKRKLACIDPTNTPSTSKIHKKLSDEENKAFMDIDTKTENAEIKAFDKINELVFEGKKANLSLAYDTLTVYPVLPPKYNFKNEVAFPVFMMFFNAMNECRGLSYVMNGDYTEDSRFRKMGKIRFVHRNCDDHTLYHQDKFNQDDDHSHIKFKSMLTNTQFIEIMNIFLKYEMISKDEKNQFIAKYETCFINKRHALDEAISEAKNQTETIIKFISECKKNENLADLHDYLLSPKFDDLRKSPEKMFHGTDEKGHVIETSESWAKIEKAISLQMSLNIEKNSRFTLELAKTQSKQLSASHPFIMVRHITENAKETDPISPTFKAFKKGDGKELEERYENHFHKKYI